MPKRIDTQAVLERMQSIYGCDCIPGRTPGLLHQFRELCAALAQEIADREALERNHIERKHIDATPDESYPLRILRAYRADCDARWEETAAGQRVTQPLTVALNKMQDQRAVILDRAIAALRGEEET